jgi:hypothetical protein
MPSATLHFLRSRWLTWGVHLGLWLLLYLAVTHTGGKTPELGETSGSVAAPQPIVPVARLDSLVSGQWPAPLGHTRGLNPFFTSHYVPPPSPSPPTTKKVDAIYQGFFQTQDNPKQAIVKVGDEFIVARVGMPVVTNQFVAEATMQMLILTNAAAQTNLLPLNAKRELEVPIK